MSERRIKINQLRRKRQLKKNLFIVMFTCIFVISCVIVFGNSFVKANSDKDVFIKYYKSIQIEQGDTLWTIAESNLSEQYESTEAYVQEVIEMNHLKDETIHAGVFLIIPYYSSEFH